MSKTSNAFKRVFRPTHQADVLSKVVCDTVEHDIPTATFNDGLITIFSEIGLGNNARYLLKIPKGARIFGANAFGSMFYVVDGVVWFLLVSVGEHVEASRDLDDFFVNVLPSTAVIEDVLERAKFERECQRLGTLKYGECFALSLLEQLGGSEKTHRYRKMPLTMYWELAAQCIANQPALLEAIENSSDDTSISTTVTVDGKIVFKQ